MRSFTIDFNAENKLPGGKNLGRKGEHNATELNITPPSEMLNNAEVEGIIIVFQVSAHRAFRSDVHEKAETINYKLPREVTRANSVAVQLEGFDSNEELVIKSDIVEGLYFDPSVCGEVKNDEEGKSLSGEIVANTLARHTHKNADVLNALADENGSLTYNGKAIGGVSARPTAQKEYTKDGGVVDFFFDNDIIWGFFWDEPTDIPMGTEVADVELIMSTINDEYVSIKELYTIDGVPTHSMVNKVVFNEEMGYIFMAIYVPTGKNSFSTAVSAGHNFSVRITYYTD